MTGDRERGVRALNYYFQASALTVYGWTFDSFLRHYDKDVGIGKDVEYLGGAIRAADLTEDKLKQLMQSLAVYGGGNKLPTKDAFFGALYHEVTRFKFEDVKQSVVAAVGQTANVVKNVAVGGAAIYLTVAAIGFVAFMSINRRAR